MFFLKPVTRRALILSDHFNQSASLSKKVAVTALHSALAAIFQSCGGLIPVAGLFISPFATAPILFCTVLSARYGILSYWLTMALLVVLQPSEVIVFPFTTGLLGVGIGLAFHHLKCRLNLILSGASALFIGIVILLLGLHFPVLGPSVDPSVKVIFPIVLFTVAYSWLWVELALFLFKKLSSHHSPDHTGI